MGAWIPAAIGAATAIGGSILGRRQDKRRDERQFAHNREMAEYAHSKDLEMWKRMNEYNTPQAQMERLTDANLNPNLMYGQGTTGTASTMPQYNAPKADYSYQPLIDPIQMLSEFQNFSQRKQNIDLTSKQVLTEEVNRWLKQSQTSNLMSKTNINQVQEQFLRNTLQDRSQYETARLIEQNAINVIQNKRAEWARQGLNPSDATWLRMTIELLESLGISPSKINSLTRGFMNNNNN